MGSQLHKQTRNDTSVWKQIVASILSAQQIHGNAADITRGRNEPWSLHFFYAKSKIFGNTHNCVRYGVLGAVRPLTCAFVRTNAMLAKTLPSQQFQIHMLYLPEARILIFKTLVFFFQKLTIHELGLASISCGRLFYACMTDGAVSASTEMWYPHTQLSKLGTIFASTEMW